MVAGVPLVAVVYLLHLLALIDCSNTLHSVTRLYICCIDSVNILNILRLDSGTTLLICIPPRASVADQDIG